MTTMDAPYTLFEMKCALVKAGMTSPVKDQICYVMLKKLRKLKKQFFLEIDNEI